MNIKKELFGRSHDGTEVMLFTLCNDQQITVKMMTYGGAVTSIRVPDKTGNLADVVLGFDTLEKYLGHHPHFGVIVGRFANRIGAGRFSLDGTQYKVAVNNGPNHLHGGIVGFDKVIWQATEIQINDAVGVELAYLSRDGEEGYPGNLRTTVKYLLTAQNELVITYEAVADKTTIVNLTNHSYFNLSGEGAGDILGHQIMINADQYTAVDQGLIPTGELRPVAGSPLDFIAARTIGSRIAEMDNGYDHNYVLNKQSKALSLAARVYEPDSGRVMEVLTTQPGIQFYTANGLDGTITGKSDRSYGKYGAFCLETQHYPDSPNHLHFPTTRLEPGETYSETTIYKFNVE